MGQVKIVDRQVSYVFALTSQAPMSRGYLSLMEITLCEQRR